MGSCFSSILCLVQLSDFLLPALLKIHSYCSIWCFLLNDLKLNITKVKDSFILQFREINQIAILCNEINTFFLWKYFFYVKNIDNKRAAWSCSYKKQSIQTIFVKELFAWKMSNNMFKCYLSTYCELQPFKYGEIL